jgi:MATE family multidrug resistance protein
MSSYFSLTVKRQTVHLSPTQSIGIEGEGNTTEMAGNDSCSGKPAVLSLSMSLDDAEDGASAERDDESTTASTTKPSEFHAAEEIWLLLSLSFPSVAIQFSMFFLFPQAASIVGRVLGTEELAGFSLGSLVGNLTCLSIVVGTLSAADTLMPRAYGRGDYPEVGRLAIRSVAACAVLLLPPIIPLCTVVERVLISIGQDSTAAALASSWIPLYLIGVPANVIFRVIQRFLVAQHRPWPPVYASVIPCVFVQPGLLRVLIPRMGLQGSALAIASTQWIMLLLLVLHLRCWPSYRPETWPGMSVVKLSHVGCPSNF